MQLRKRKNVSEFKPDVNPSTFSKTVRLTRLQKLQLGKWLLYCGICVLCIVVQDVVMSQLRLFGATTDLAVSAILLIAMLEGTEVGSLFLLIASTVYFFTGSAPGAFSIALITVLGTAAVLLRQMYLHRSRGCLIACAAAAVILYEIGTLVAGALSGLTLWVRFPCFLFTGLYSALTLIPLYGILEKIGLIGGNTWKE